MKVPYGLLTRQQFASVTRLIESMQGRWISAGRDSHWEVPKQKRKLPGEILRSALKLWT